MIGRGERMGGSNQVLAEENSESHSLYGVGDIGVWRGWQKRCMNDVTALGAIDGLAETASAAVDTQNQNTLNIQVDQHSRSNPG